jgi:predicted permease
MIDRIAEIGRRVWYLLNRSRFERELREEMGAHRAQMGTRGPRFGDELRLREDAADAWGWGWLDRLEQDVRFGTRLLVRAPAFTLTAILVLSLGIGVNLAAYQVFDAVTLSWLPVRAPQTLVNLSSRTSTGRATSFSYPEYRFYSTRSRLIATMFGLVDGNVDFEGTPGANAEFVNAAYLSDLGVRPVAGRLLDPGDERSDAPPVLLLGEGTWRSRFGADPSIIGRTVRVQGHPFAVVGIVPSTFTAFHGRVALWIPVTQHAAVFSGSTLVNDWSSGAVRLYARLQDGVTIGAAQSELSALAATLHRERPADTPEGQWIELRPAGKYLPLDEASGVVLALVAVLVLLVLVTACMNLGVLVLARMVGREREFALRLSMGASRGRILRQLMTEHLMLGLFGAAAGCAVAAAAARAFAVATDLPRGVSTHLNWRSIAISALCAVLSAFVFGLTPAFQAIRPSSSRQLRLRNVLLAVQIAAASVLLIVSGLLVRGVTRIVRVDLGFDYQHTLVADPDLSSHGLKSAASVAYWSRVDARMRQIPGVVDAGVTTLAPFGNHVSIDRDRTLFYGVTASYFSTMRIRLVRGRIFQDGEKGVVVVSESLVHRRWPDVDPLGQKFNGSTVIGVVGTARTVRLGELTAGECYRPLDPTDALGPPSAVLIVRTSGPPHDVAANVAAAARTVGPGITPTVRSLSDAFEDTLAGPRKVVLVASSLGVTALMLAVTGLGGLIAYTVSQRQREIGIRVAIGARPVHVVAAIVRQLRMSLLSGALAGSALAAVAGTAMSRELFGISRFDPLAHGGALLLFAVVAACASAPPLRRALRVDPATTLRME